MANINAVRGFFAIAALYDGVLGALFLGAGPRMFDFAGIPYPNHWGYVHFAACILILFALMFARIAAAPRSGRTLIIWGVLLKLSYCGVVFGHLVFNPERIPMLWVWFGVADLAFLVGFVWARWMLGRPTRDDAAPPDPKPAPAPTEAA